MEALSTSFQPDKIEWHHIAGDDPATYNLDYEYSLLGYDIEAGKLDMMMKFGPDSGYCEPHSHIAATTLVILEGEQHVEEQLPDGSTKKIVRKAGEYAMTGRDAHPHLETGGPDGLVIFLSLQTDSGKLFGVYDPEFNKLMDVDIQFMVDRWNARHEEAA